MLTWSRVIPWVGRLLALTIVFTFFLVPFGALVRSTDSGLACPDWPLCHDQIIPNYREYPKYIKATPEERAHMDSLLSEQQRLQERHKDMIEGRTKNQALAETPHFKPHQVYFEFLHRAWAGIVSILLLCLVLIALVAPQARAILGGWIFAAVALIISQIILGQLTVLKLLDPVTVASHLLNAVVFFMALQGAAVRWGFWLARGPASGPECDRGINGWWKKIYAKMRRPEITGKPWSAFAAFGAVMAQLGLGAMVSANYLGLACFEFPSCDGESWLPMSFGPGVHMAHRYWGYVTLIAMAAFRYQMRGVLTGINGAIAHTVFVLTLLQVLLGILNVLSHLPHFITVAHTVTGLAIAAGMFWLLVNWHYLTRPPVDSAAG